MSNEQIAQLNDFIDKCVNAISTQLTPGIWVLALIALTIYAIKALMTYNKSNTANKSEVHDKLDSHTFKDAVVPLLSEFNNQLQGDAVARLELTGQETTEEIIAHYEEKKVESTSLTDISTLEASISLTDTLDKMAKARKRRKTYDSCYKAARRCLQFGVVTLGLNLAIGVWLMLLVLLSATGTVSRLLFILWVGLVLTNLILLVVYVVHKTRMDGYIDDEE